MKRSKYHNIYRRIWIDENIDFICLEILDKDDIIEINNPYEVNKSCYNKDYIHKEFHKKGIILPSIGIKKEIELPQGIIYYVKNKKEYFLHNCNTEKGFSGAPIILIYDLSIIGMQRGYDSKNKKI